MIKQPFHKHLLFVTWVEGPEVFTFHSAWVFINPGQPTCSYGAVLSPALHSLLLMIAVSQCIFLKRCVEKNKVWLYCNH